MSDKNIFQDADYLQKNQYRDGRNLNARARIASPLLAQPRWAGTAGFLITWLCNQGCACWSVAAVPAGCGGTK